MCVYICACMCVCVYIYIDACVRTISCMLVCASMWVLVVCSCCCSLVGGKGGGGGGGGNFYVNKCIWKARGSFTWSISHSTTLVTLLYLSTSRITPPSPPPITSTWNTIHHFIQNNGSFTPTSTPTPSTWNTVTIILHRTLIHSFILILVCQMYCGQ